MIIAQNKNAIKLVSILYDSYRGVDILNFLNNILYLDEHEKYIYHDIDEYTGDKYTYYELEMVDPNPEVFTYEEISLIYLFEKYEVNLKTRKPADMIDVNEVEFIFY